MSGDIPSAQVTQSGDELSCSIEETNRIRISLGMKPLVVEDKAAARKEAEVAREAYAKKQDEEAMRAKLEKAKNKRKLHERLAGPSIAEEVVEEDGDADDVMAWVNKSRKIEQERKDRAEREAKEKAERLQREEDEEAKAGPRVSTKGLLLRHKADQFQEGEEMILTLADQRIVASNGDMIDDGDELENVNLVENQKWERNNKIRKETKKPDYDPFDDSKKNILAKYDSEEEQEKIELDDDGADVVKKERAAAIRERLARAADAKAAGKVAYTLGEAAKQEISEYYTTEEMVSFKKKTRKVVKKSTRKKVTDELDLEPLESGADHGSRAKKQEVGGDDERRKGFEQAKAKAAGATAHLQDISSVALKQDKSDDESDDAELAAALARNRRLVQQKKAPKDIVAMVEVTRRNEEQRKANDTTNASTIQFTETTEFVREIDVDHERQKDVDTVVKRKAAEAAAAADEHQNNGGGDRMEVDQGDAHLKGSASESESEEDDDLGGMVEKPMANKGLASVLGLIKHKGFTSDVERTWTGRAKDEKMDVDKLNETGVRLEYLDKEGRQLTTKEAFRQMSWKFHNKAPSKNKVEKKQAREELEAARRRANDPMQSMAVIAERQKVAATPFLMLSGHGARAQQEQVVGQIEKKMKPKK